MSKKGNSLRRADLMAELLVDSDAAGGNGVGGETKVVDAAGEIVGVR
jgi:hypothetical protein